MQLLWQFEISKFKFFNLWKIIKMIHNNIYNLFLIVSFDLMHLLYIEADNKGIGQIKGTKGRDTG
jgi:hypothetical protein